ncbi:recombinase family protein [Roseibium polysiphoniae]|uniref:Recombinase family protein n=1 Tax=Roseibium polysiphoniae TaxID=2571221 RepID=A0A944CHN9_9HYPH|nr:recombinase family protein [Roseibium polysiphoniae]MBS8262812.1 recombinase family protein [Roseibium polysiphoniae]
MKKIRCAVYTRKSSEEGLDQDFNSLDAQREACAAYIASQKHEGWVLLDRHYDDGGLSGGNMNRPALQRLLQDVDEGLVDQIVVYKIDRLTRSLTDFARLVDRLDLGNASFVSVTQSFNTATSMGRLTLNVLLSFAQFEREVTAERIRDKIAASKKKGMWMGGLVPLGYRASGRTLEIEEEEAKTIRTLFELYLELGTVAAAKDRADQLGLVTRKRSTKTGKAFGGKPFDTSHLHAILTNPIYCGKIRHKKQIHDGLHPAIVDHVTWEAVQQQLAGNAAYERSKGTRATAPSPLQGKLFDDTGDRLVPSHCNKKGRRYRYYVSSRLIKPTPKDQDNGPDDPIRADGWRLPAAALETELSAAINRHLTNVGAVGLLGKLDSDITAIDRIDRRFAQMPASPCANTLALLKRCRVLPGEISIELDDEALADHFEILKVQINPDILQTTVPFTRRRRGVEAKLIVGHHRDGSPTSSKISSRASPNTSSRDQVLIKNIRAAHRWYKLVQRGESFSEIAKRENQSVNTVQRVIPLTFLAPDIVRDILRGQQPVSLTSDWLLRQTLPSDFDDQRALIQSLT